MKGKCKSYSRACHQIKFSYFKITLFSGVAVNLNYYHNTSNVYFIETV